MIEIKNFRDEAVTLTKWLVAIPSITGTAGEQVIMQAVYEGLSAFGYFKAHPQQLRLIPHRDGRNHSILALVTPGPQITDTLVVLCNTDTSGNSCYGVLKPLAFKCDELKERLPSTVRDNRLLEHLRDPGKLFGLGIFESKSAAAAMIVALKDFSDQAATLPLNLLFVCTSNQINSHQGIRECVREIHSMMREYSLTLRLTLNYAPQLNQGAPQVLPLYTANKGQIEACFYIFGQGSGYQNPFAGFSPTLIAAKILQKTELNPRITANLSKRALVPNFRYLNYHNNRSSNSPDAVQLGFNLPFVNLSLPDLIEELKHVAAQALEETAVTTDDRQSVYSTLQGNDYEPFNRDAEIIAYSDLFYRASRHYRGDLASAIEGLLQKCHQEGLSTPATARTVIERLNDLAHLPRPSVVIYLGNDFVPQQRLSQNNSQDRELYIKIDRAVTDFNAHSEFSIEPADEYPPADSCFLRPIGIDAALKTLTSECPIPVSSFYNLGAPALTLCLKGEGLYTAAEHLPVEMFDVMLRFLQALIESLTAGAEPAGAEDDLAEPSRDEHEDRDAPEDEGDGAADAPAGEPSAVTPTPLSTDRADDAATDAQAR